MNKEHSLPDYHHTQADKLLSFPHLPVVEAYEPGGDENGSSIRSANEQLPGAIFVG